MKKHIIFKLRFGLVNLIHTYLRLEIRYTYIFFFEGGGLISHEYKLNSPY